MTIAINTLTTLLTLMLVTVAALGVLNMVVLETRERVHDLGVHKALGMTPRQTIAMVIASVVVTGAGRRRRRRAGRRAVHGLVMPEMGDAVGFNLPASVIDIYQPPSCCCSASAAWSSPSSARCCRPAGRPAPAPPPPCAPSNRARR